MTAATTTRDVPAWVALSATLHSIGYVQVGPWRTRVL
jgi:2-hydroxy-6-oxonona-2,4-dienedioate hydrolase